jgi:putative oxidoreductase
MSLIAAVIGRLLLAAMFIVSGMQKIADPGPTAQMLSATNLPASFALPTGLFEVIAGVLLAIGLMTRLVSLVLAGFVALTIFFFHNQFADPLQGTLALKNLAIIGGLLMTFAYGQMRGSYDYLREKRRTHNAEVRAARAEGRAEGAAEVPQTVVTDVDGTGTATVRAKRRWF